MPIPEGYHCSSAGEIPLLGCCDVTSTVYGIGLMLTLPPGAISAASTYQNVIDHQQAVRDFINALPGPLEEYTPPNTVSLWGWDGTEPLPNPADIVPPLALHDGCPFEPVLPADGSLYPPVHAGGTLSPFVAPLATEPNRVGPYFPFASLKHEPIFQDRLDGQLVVLYWRVSAIRVKVLISPDHPQLRRRLISGRSFGRSCQAPGHRWDLNPDFEDFVIESAEVIDNPLSIELAPAADRLLPINPNPDPHPAPDEALMIAEQLTLP